MDLSENFNQAELSDVVLHFYTSQSGSNNHRICSKQVALQQGTASEGSLGLQFNQSSETHLEGHALQQLGPGSDQSGDQPAMAVLSAAGQRSFYTHSILLYTSPYFKSLLQRWSPALLPPALALLPHPIMHCIQCQQRLSVAGTESAAGAAEPAAAGAVYVPPGPLLRHGRIELVECVEDDEELEAVELMLRGLYKPGLPPEALGRAKLLLQTYSLADKYQFPAHMMELLVCALAALQPEDLDVRTLAALYSLPEGLLDREPCRRVTAKAQRALVLQFGDVPAVITQRAVRELFCSLPYAAVLAWLKQDDLRVYSENCVVFLLSAWLNSYSHRATQAAAAAGSSSEAQQLEQLADNVRAAHLSPAYLHSVLPNLPWFRSCRGMVLLPHLHLLKATGGKGSVSWRGPLAWQIDQPPRTGTIKAPAPTELSLDITSSQLEILDSGIVVVGPSVYCNGIFFQLCALSRQGDLASSICTASSSNSAGAGSVRTRTGSTSLSSTDTCSLGSLQLQPMYSMLVGVHVDSASMAKAVGPWEDNQAVLIEASFTTPVLADCEMEALLTGSIGRGPLDGQLPPSTSIEQLVAPFLVDGHLKLHARITSVE